MAAITSTFDAAVHDAHVWVNEVADKLELDDRRRALHILRGVLHAFRNRLPVDVLANLSAQLPLLIRGLFFEGWEPNEKPRHPQQLDDFAEALDRELRGFEKDVVDVEDAVRAVFAVLGTHVSLGEWRKIGKILPAQLAVLWDESGI
jgi:uncharacterized protein (DUF2267 family)